MDQAVLTFLLRRLFRRLGYPLRLVLLLLLN